MADGVGLTIGEIVPLNERWPIVRELRRFRGPRGTVTEILEDARGMIAAAEQA